MNKIDEKRVEKITYKIIDYSRKKLEYIRLGDLESAQICSRMIDVLFNKQKDIIEGIEDIMAERKDSLQRERIRVENLIKEVPLKEKRELKKELYQIDEALNEERIREYARSMKNAKVKKKGAYK